MQNISHEMLALDHSSRLLITQSHGFYTSKQMDVLWSHLYFTGLFCLNISEKQEQIRKGFAKLWESLRNTSMNRQEGKQPAYQQSFPSPLWVPRQMCLFLLGWPLFSGQAEDAQARTDRYHAGAWSLWRCPFSYLTPLAYGRTWWQPECAYNEHTQQAEGRLLKSLSEDARLQELHLGHLKKDHFWNLKSPFLSSTDVHWPLLTPCLSSSLPLSSLFDENHGGYWCIKDVITNWSAY